MQRTHRSARDGKEYYADDNVLLAHVVSRHAIFGDANAGQFDVTFLGDAAKLWSIVCEIVDHGDFEDRSNVSGTVHSRIWYLNFFGRGNNSPTGRGRSTSARATGPTSARPAT